MSLKFTKFKQNNNHNKKKTRKDYKKTKKKVCVLYGGAKSGPPKPGKVKSLAAAYEQKLSKTQTTTKTPRPKTGLLSSFRMSTKKAKAQASQAQASQAQPSPQQKEKSKAPSFLSRLGSSISSFGGFTLGERYGKYNWGVTPPKLKKSSSQVSQNNKTSSEAAIAASLEKNLKNGSPGSEQEKILSSQPNLTGSVQEGNKPPETGPAQDKNKIPGTLAESTGPPKPEPLPAGPAKLESPPAGPPQPATPEPSPVPGPGPKTTGLGGPTQPPAPPVPPRSLRGEAAPPILPRRPRGEAEPPPVPPRSLKPVEPQPAQPAPPALIVPKIDETYIPKNEFEQQLQKARENLKNAKIPKQKPLELPLSPATVELKPIPAKNSTPAHTNTPNIPRTVTNITPKETGITTFGSSKNNPTKISVKKAKKNINSVTFTELSKNTGNVLSQTEKQVEVGELPKKSIFGNRVKSKPITQKSTKSVTNNPVIPT